MRILTCLGRKGSAAGGWTRAGPYLTTESLTPPSHLDCLCIAACAFVHGRGGLPTAKSRRPPVADPEPSIRVAIPVTAEVPKAELSSVLTRVGPRPRGGFIRVAQ